MFTVTSKLTYLGILTLQNDPILPKTLSNCPISSNLSTRDRLNISILFLNALTGRGACQCMISHFLT